MRSANGDVVDRPPVDAPVVAGTVVIFVHGYSVDVAKARTSYGAHEEKLRARIGVARLPGVLWFHWPGDHPFGVPLVGRLMAKLAYPFMIGRAERSGKVLAQYLHDSASVTLRVRLVAHSLGNRVVLEALNELARLDQTSPRPFKVDRVHLMAAAVPVSFCERGGDFAKRVNGRREVVSCSGQDSVLGAAFPAGEIFETRWAEAVGRRGNPPFRWGVRHSTNLEHKDYWSDESTAAITARALDWDRRPLPPQRPVPRRAIKRRVLAAVRIID